jgi:hypothetical protein
VFSNCIIYTYAGGYRVGVSVVSVTTSGVWVILRKAETNIKCLKTESILMVSKSTPLYGHSGCTIVPFQHRDTRFEARLGHGCIPVFMFTYCNY